MDLRRQSQIKYCVLAPEEVTEDASPHSIECGPVEANRLLARCFHDQRNLRTQLSAAPLKHGDEVAGQHQVLHISALN